MRTSDAACVYADADQDRHLFLSRNYGRVSGCSLRDLEWLLPLRSRVIAVASTSNAEIGNAALKNIILRELRGLCFCLW